ncbi:hypothetical protein [Vibrio rotiferianus]|uniref:hypothetical protein n=1 Tax=Vibrio rotiferianus TaxID=190895 RepID=UPI0005EE288E|nr:hypothetical protein [Vibrio rotiferianus]
MFTNRKILLVGLCSIALNGCLSLSNEHSKESETIDHELTNIDVLKKASKRDYAMIDLPYSNKTPYSASQRNIDWLKSKKLSLSINKNAGMIAVKEILRQLTSEGVNISTTLPIDNYFYQGYPIAKNTDAYTALQILTEAVGLDFKVIDNGVSRFVQIQEMGTTEYSLVVPDVKVAMEVVSGKKEESESSSDDSEENSSKLASNTTVDNKTVYVNEFWDTLKKELESRLTIMVPDTTTTSSANSYGYEPGQPTKQDFAGYKEVKVGKIIINSVTGNIAITAPKNVRDRITQYLTNVDQAINTGIQVTAKVVTVTRSDRETAGVDVNALLDIGDSYGLAFGNDTLGNLVITDPTKGLNISASNALTNTLFGVTKNDGKFSAFLDYMKLQGETKALSDVTTSVRSGRSAVLSKVSNEPRINSSSQSSTTDGGTTTGGTTNSITNDETGILTTITPVYDPKRGVVHSLLSVKVILDAGESVQAEPLISGDEIQIIERTLKNTDVIDLQTETLSKNGELIIAGGITTQKVQENDGGMRWLKDSFVGGLFGKASRDIQYTDYYILVETRVVPIAQN